MWDKSQYREDTDQRYYDDRRLKRQSLAPKGLGRDRAREPLSCLIEQKSCLRWGREDQIIRRAGDKEMTEELASTIYFINLWLWVGFGVAGVASTILQQLSRSTDYVDLYAAFSSWHLFYVCLSA